MNETTTASPVVPPAATRFARLRGRLAAPFRRPLRSLAILLLLGLIGLGVVSAAIPLYASYHLSQAKQSVDRYRYADAQRHLVAAGRWRPSDPRLPPLAARVARRLGDFDRAEEFLDRWQDRVGLTDEVALERILLKVERGDLEHLQLFCRRKIDEKDPSSPQILEALASGFLRLYRLADSETCLTKWLDEDPENLQALTLLGQVYELRDNQQGAIACYRRALQRDPDADDVRLSMAALLLDLSQAREAAPHAEYVVARQPNNLQAALLLARCRDQEGLQAEAEKILERLTTRAPQFGPAWFERGKLAHRQGQLENAETWLTEAVALSPGDYATNYNLAQVLRERDKVAPAREIEERLKVIEKDIRDSQSLYSFQMQRNPNSVEMHHKAGMIALRAGNPREAIRWLESAERLDPDHVPTQEALARYYALMGEPGRSAMHVDRAKKLTAEGKGKAPETPAPAKKAKDGDKP